jgi:hypothetical protein
VPKKAYITKVNQGDIEILGQISPTLIERIQLGLGKSTQTEPFILKAFAHKIK